MVVLKFQTITVPSTEPETTYFRLGLKTTLHAWSLWPLNERFKAGSPAGPSIFFDNIYYKNNLNLKLIQTLLNFVKNFS